MMMMMMKKIRINTVYKEWMFVAFNLLVMQPHATVIFTLTWKHQFLFHTRAGVLSSFVLFFLVSFIPWLIPYFHFWTRLFSITVLLQRLYTIRAATGSWSVIAQYKQWQYHISVTNNWKKTGKRDFNWSCRTAYHKIRRQWHSSCVWNR
jgi:hypothetical protein